MNYWLVIITLLNIFLLIGLGINTFLKVKEKKEDLRINKGLQHLQNKISILEDLSDKTDSQVRKLIQLLDQKTNEVRELLQSTESNKQQIINLTQESQEILQELIQHQSLNHNDNSNQHKTSQYVQAAKLAHQGKSLEEIMQQVDLSPAEINMIIKVNKDQLQFAADQIPQWMNRATPKNSDQAKTELFQSEVDQFAQALQQQNFMYKTPQNQPPQTFTEDTTSTANKAIHTQQGSQSPESTQTKPQEPNIRPFTFKRITT